MDLWTKIRSKLAAACYTIHGLDKPALFTNGDKNHDGFLDLVEVGFLLIVPSIFIAFRLGFTFVTNV